jgi:hypothetical protein
LLVERKKNISIIIEVLRYITVNRKHENEQKYNPSANIFFKKNVEYQNKTGTDQNKEVWFQQAGFLKNTI